MKNRERISPEERFYLASQWQLMWRKFIKHKLAIAGGVILVVLYLLGIFCEFFSPYDIYKRHEQYIYCVPQRIHFFDDEGNFHLHPFVYGVKKKIDPVTWAKIYTLRTKQRNILFTFSFTEMVINSGAYFLQTSIFLA